MMKKVLCSIAFIFITTFVFAADSVTITTYYPSPYGIYREVRAKRMAIGDSYTASASYSWDTGTIDPVADLVVEANVGIGTSTPGARLDVVAPGTGMSSIMTRVSGVTLGLMPSDGLGSPYSRVTSSHGMFVASGAGRDLRLATNNGVVAMTIDSGQLVGIGTTTPAGRLDVSGAIYQRGGLLHADYVFEPDYKLEPIEEHAQYMWKYKHLKAVPEGKVDEKGQQMVEIGANTKGILEELEKAHVYIAQLNERIKFLEAKLNKSGK